MERSKESSENDERLSYYDRYFREVLSPIEPTIMKVQSLLVWEKPVRSAVMIACVHCIFWVFMYSGCRFYSTTCYVIMALFFLRTWKKKIWPEIRVPPKGPELDEWTPVHPKLLSVPELCKHLSSTWCYLLHCINWWTTLRRERPLKFCIETTFIFTCLAVVGHYISDVMLSYIIIMSVILWPCLQYHNLLKKIYMKFEPVFMKLDYSIKVKNKWRYEGDRSEVTKCENMEDDGLQTSSLCADNESDLEDFYPTDPMISAALARAITDSEDEGGTPSTSLTPGLSKEPSVTNSDDEINHTDDIVAEFAPSIDMMPSYDAMDHTDDELLLDLPGEKPPRASRESSEESMKFIPSHFDGSDNEDDSVMVVADAPKTKLRRKSTRETRHKQVESAQSFMRSALSSMVSSAIESTLVGTLQNLAAKSNPSLTQPGDRLAGTQSDTDEDTMATSDPGQENSHRDQKGEEDTASLNIEDEFEFLEDYEFGSSVEDET